MSLANTDVPPTEPAGGAGPATDGRAVGSQPGFGRRLLRQPMAVVALAYLILIILACAFAPLIAPYGPYTQDLMHTLSGPSAQHLLGTDDLGRDVLSRLLYGGQTTLLGVAEAVVVVAIVGTVFGITAGYLGGWADHVISRVVDVVISIPSVIVILGVLAIFGNNMTTAMITFGLVAGGALVRVVRSVTLAVRQELYVAAARVSGVSQPSIVFRHILPRLTGPVIVQLSLFAGVALAFQTGLAFLDLGTIAPAPSWGGMVATASTLLSEEGWLLIPSGGIIALTILAFAFIGDAARDASAEAWSGNQPSRRQGRAARSGRPSPTADGGAQAADGQREGTAPAAPARPPEPGAVLSVRDLTVCFGQGARRVTVVDGVSFDIFPGEVVGLVGESGSGKTMTALSLLGLLPSGGTVERGTATLAGRDLLALNARDLRALRGTEIALISQEPMSSLDPVFRVGSQLGEIVRCHHGLSRKAARVRTLELLEMVRLPEPADIARRYAHELSGGQAQRVAIAAALAAEPKLLIADEPTTALDVTVQAEILELLRTLQDSHQMAVIFVTHNLAVVADICARAIVMQRGKIVESSDVHELFAAPRHDYTRSLLAATPSLLDDAARPRPEPDQPARHAPTTAPATSEVVHD